MATTAVPAVPPPLAADDDEFQIERNAVWKRFRRHRLAIVGGVVPRQFFPAVEKGVRDGLRRGPVAGFPVVDVHVTLIDGAFHAVDSSEAAFKTAAGMALRDGLPKCSPVLLEPIVHVEAIVPEESASAILGGLTAKRGHVLSFEPAERN